jgi:hypothetical protein
MSESYPEIKDTKRLEGDDVIAVKVPPTAETYLLAISILYLHLKKHLAGQKFHKYKEVKNEVTVWLLVQAVKFYDIGIQTSNPG